LTGTADDLGASVKMLIALQQAAFFERQRLENGFV
jgi:hypothetical protein